MMLIDEPTDEIYKLKLKIVLQQERNDKQVLEILNLKAQLTEVIQKNAEEFFREVSSIRYLASVFVHELNQPLTAIMAYSHSCLYTIKSNSKPERVITLLEEMTEQAEHLGSIINEIKSLLQNGDLQLEITEINPLIQDALSILKDELQGTSLTLNLNSNLPPIMTNKMHVMHTLINLIRTSINSSETPVELHISTQVLKGTIVIQCIFKNPILSKEALSKSWKIASSFAICQALIGSVAGVLTSYQENDGESGFTLSLPIGN